MAKFPKQCPACHSHLMVTQLACPECATEVRGRFEPDFFAQLSPTDYDFVVLFVKTKGNIKEMERELGISYWTIRSKLNDIVNMLEGNQPPAENRPDPDRRQETLRQEILEQLNAGILTVQEAAAKLEKLKSRPA